MHKSANESADAYKVLRQQARDLVWAYLEPIVPLGTSLSDLNDDAVAQANEWGGFRWGYIAKKFQRRPRRVELAIWYDGVLCGIACGRVSNRRIVASIHYLESNPSMHPLRGSIAAIATRFLDTMALLAGCSEASIQNPVQPLIEFYKALGYVRETTRGCKVLRLNKVLA
jgi:hypothetical protein